MELIKAALGVALIACAWLAIELAWRKTFGRDDNPRLSGCSGCSTCDKPCENRSGPRSA